MHIDEVALERLSTKPELSHQDYKMIEYKRTLILIKDYERQLELLNTHKEYIEKELDNCRKAVIMYEKES